MENNFNSVDFMDTLIGGGFTDQQAKAVTSAVLKLIDSHLVTKDYIDMKLVELRSASRVEFRSAISDLKAELIKWMVSILIVQTGATALMFTFLH